MAALRDMIWKYIQQHPDCTSEDVRVRMNFIYLHTASYHIENLKKEGRLETTAHEDSLPTFRALTPVVIFG